MSAENFGSDDLGIPGFLDRRDEVPRHVCAQCRGRLDGKEEPVRHGDALVWLQSDSGSAKLQDSTSAVGNGPTVTGSLWS
jgi:hypothetical protein